ncbi:unknown [Crocosphaera subtropica ATCC 51142]|uniref:Uncharacterized protein n=1 Tax=Crocosphaera subtropica (strain ATCC 51142 / BH68) TaxID=43989 RepID=B1X308_CROS5|nr:hypothetical protein [Crocosphaera subtropica]ACB54519.1 unknown [Crocosphaera subtropica ATCC 51142]
MENQKPQWTLNDDSILSLATHLHRHFRDLQSYYKIAKGNLLSQIEATSAPQQLHSLQQQLLEVEEKLTYFHVLNNSISTVDTILHTSKMITEFKQSSDFSTNS